MLIWIGVVMTTRLFPVLFLLAGTHFASGGLGPNTSPAGGVLTPGPESVTGSVSNRVLGLDGQTGCVLVPDSQSLHALSNALTLEGRSRGGSFDPANGAV